MLVRPGTPADLPALTAIYNHYVSSTYFTFDLETYTDQSRRPWFDQFEESGPHRLFVAVDEPRGEVLGYACSSPFAAKAAYRTSVETTVYVTPGAARRGIGRALYARLLDALAAAGVHRAYAGIALPNPASVAFHERFGFARAGVFREVGEKFGRYRDVAWFEREIGSLPDGGAPRSP